VRAFERPGCKYGRIILKWSSGNRIGWLGLTDLPKEWDNWRVLMNAVMNIGVQYNAGYFLTF